jgi:hypothetical protein
MAKRSVKTWYMVRFRQPSACIASAIHGRSACSAKERKIQGKNAIAVAAAKERR